MQPPLSNGPERLGHQELARWLGLAHLEVANGLHTFFKQVSARETAQGRTKNKNASGVRTDPGRDRLGMDLPLGVRIGPREVGREKYVEIASREQVEVLL